MEFQLKKIDITKQKCDLLVLTKYEGQRISGNLKKINDKLNGALEAKIKNKKYESGFGKTITLDTLGRLPYDSVIIIGMGKKKELTPERIFKGGAMIGQSIDKYTKDIVVDFQLGNGKWHLASLLEGISAGNYKFTKYKTGNNKDDKQDPRFTIAVKNPKSKDLQYQSEYATKLSEAVRNARDIVNEPPEYLTPTKLAEIAKGIAENGGLKIDVFGTDRMEEYKMGGILSVTRGSGQPPKFIHLTYTPSGKKPKKEIAVVGKGITFDSGGLNLKPGDSMRTMKMDMAGGAAVLGVMEAVSRIKPQVKVHGIVPASENMTGSMAYKPDDVIYAMNGKSIEIINTDAEGRLVLADALSYCSNLKLDEIIDFATLTGACIVALGQTTAGIMGNDQEMVDRISKTSSQVGEKIWQLPLDEDIKKELESDVADIKNAGSRAGGAIYAGLFLENFVPEDVHWSHIDIAGPAFITKGNEFYSSGATGFGVRTVTRYLAEI